MRPYSTKEKFKITAAAIAAVVIVGMMAVTGPPPKANWAIKTNSAPGSKNLPGSAAYRHWATVIPSR